MKVMNGRLGCIIAALALAVASPALAQKAGGVLKIQHMDSPPSASIHEEATVSVAVPFMSLYNNLVMFDHHVAKNSLDSVVPDLATKWAWTADNTKLVFTVSEGVKRHDGKPFSAKDVACTFDLMLGGESEAKLRRNPRSSWWTNVEKVTADSDTQATFHLKAPQPSLLALLASGYTPIYPCHIPPDQMRRKPVGTGPFKLAEFKMNEGIKLTKNADYWKKGRPYLDGIEFTIMPDRGTRMLAFIAGKFDMTFPTDVSVPLLKNIRKDAPKAVCTMRESGVSVNLIINREAAPFDNPKIRRALALTLDRKAFIDIISEGEDKMAGIMLPPPDGGWGMTPEMMKDLPGYGDVAQARELDPKKRQQMVWDIDHKLQAEIARPIIYYGRAAGCWQPQVKNVTLHINSIYNNWRFEDVWLER